MIETTHALEPRLTGDDLTAPSARPADRNPALVYLARLPSPASKRTMRTALDNLAMMFTGGASRCHLNGLEPHPLPARRRSALEAPGAVRISEDG